jgi:predicted NBD/HSP70 family sugar kinase
MAERIDVGQGVCLGFGGTNARVAACIDGDIEGFAAVPTAKRPQPFFKWMSRQVLQAAHDGNQWVVAGFPGPVSEDGTLIGPMQNVEGMSRRQFNLVERLTKADPAVGEILDEGFNLVAVNDGTLSAHAAAKLVSEFAHESVAGLIFGTGIGTGLVEKDPAYEGVYRTDVKHPLEIGHVPGYVSHKTTNSKWANKYTSYEQWVAGGVLKDRYSVDPENLPFNSEAFKDISVTAVRIASTLGLLLDLKLLVPCGGVGIGTAGKYAPFLKAEIAEFMEQAKKEGSKVKQDYFPEIVPAPKEFLKDFEMYGAEGVMREHLTAA